MSDQRIKYHEEISKEKNQKELKEARLQYEKVYYELKRKILGDNNVQLKPLIDDHNKKVVEYFKILLEEQTNKAKQSGVEFTNQDYERLVKEIWKRMYIFE